MWAALGEDRYLLWFVCSLVVALEQFAEQVKEPVGH
jgi:hypothetical protein